MRAYRRRALLVVLVAVGGLSVPQPAMAAEQATLTLTYSALMAETGSRITLGTTGGSGNGAVT